MPSGAIWPRPGQIRSSTPITGAALSPDGARIVTVDRDGVAAIRDRTTGTCSLTRKVSPSSDHLLAISPDERYVAIAADGRTWPSGIR